MRRSVEISRLVVFYCYESEFFSASTPDYYCGIQHYWIVPSVELCSFNLDYIRPPRSVRKVLFDLHICKPRRRSTSTPGGACGDIINTEVNKPDEHITVGLLNLQSINHRSMAVSDTISAQHLHVMVLTET